MGKSAFVVILIGIIMAAILLIVVWANPVDMSETSGSRVVNGVQGAYDGYADRFKQENTSMDNAMSVMNNVTQ